MKCVRRKIECHFRVDVSEAGHNYPKHCNKHHDEHHDRVTPHCFDGTIQENCDEHTVGGGEGPHAGMA
jgi:hypothetical protein